MDVFRVGYFGGIKKFECIKETEKFYVLADGNKVAKRSGWHNYFSSWDEAKNFVVSNAEQALADAKRKVDICRSNLETAKAIKPASTEASADQSPQVVNDSLPLVNSITGDGS